MSHFMDGNQAIALGAIDAGCDFFAGYPITPATGILLHLAEHLPQVGGLVLQGEDEIASMGFCIGAAMSGRRVMTATSGPGISLYSENIGLAIMGEVPMVIVDVQRMGPATGAATTGAQGDIQFLRWVTSGGYPVIVFAPTTVEECYTLTIKAFDLAERFRVPVFIATDKETALTKTTTTLGRKNRPQVRDRKTADPEIDFIPLGIEAIDEVPAMSPFGGPHKLRFTTSSHDERGYLTKDPEALDRLNRHLAAKIEAHVDEITMLDADLEEGAQTAILSYGISARSAKAAAKEARQGGKKVSLITIYSLWPVPEGAIRASLKGVQRIIVPELNLGQYTREIERLAKDDQEVIGVHRVDGKLISPMDILDQGGLL
ncbi:MAG: 2-oxoacid:acceptor oxidoreductase subunit alpha [Anaerolineales bacterium]